MPLSTQATKYRDDFVKTARAAGERVATREYRGDLDLIKEVNKAISELEKVRDKHVRS
jgi:hypothetical protein